MLLFTGTWRPSVDTEIGLVKEAVEQALQQLKSRNPQLYPNPQEQRLWEVGFDRLELADNPRANSVWARSVHTLLRDVLN